MPDISFPPIPNIPPVRGIRPGEERPKRKRPATREEEEEEQKKTPPEKGRIDITA